MKSIKPGRGPSFMSGLASAGAALFGVFWTVFAAAMGAWFMVPFGLIFVGLGVANAIYDFKNATNKNRYSSFDIVDGGEEPDPLNVRYGGEEPDPLNVRYGGAQNGDAKDSAVLPSSFCPYCGAPAEGDFAFCNRCGKQLP